MVERNAFYEDIGYKLIEELPEFDYIKNSPVRIAYLGSDEEKHKQTKTVFAECIRVNKNYSWCCAYDFMIVVYEPNVIDFDDAQLEHLIEHELHHVGISNDGNEPSYHVVPHDVEEFWQLIDKYGLNWSETHA